MRFDDQDVDVSGVDDRRGHGGAIALGGGGLGIVGLIVYVLVSVMGGGTGTGGLPLPGASGVDVGGTGESRQELQERCNTEGAIDRYNDCYLIKVYGEINEVWTAELDGYRPPALGFYEQGVQTRCGVASSQVGPFYCPADSEIYIDIGFLNALQDRFGARGRYAQAYILAHETGHHLQNLLGTERQVRSRMSADPDQRRALSIALELQADCYAGAWSALADRRGNVTISQAEVDQALTAAAAVGDDRIQARTSGRVDPESWTHGSAQQRRAAFQRGFDGAALGACGLRLA